MTRNELIDDTIDYYRTHPRGLNLGSNTMGETIAIGCVYRDGSRRCAVGRCVDWEKVDRKPPTNSDAIWYLRDSTAASITMDTALEPLNDVLLPAYQGQSLSTWIGLQRLHDRHSNWQPTATGWELTTEGKRAAEALKTRE